MIIISNYKSQLEIKNNNNKVKLMINILINKYYGQQNLLKYQNMLKVNNIN